MSVSELWLIKLLLAHLLTDFILQPASWVKQRQERHFASIFLYVHGLVTALVAWLFIGRSYGKIALIVLVTHILIDAWKSYRPRTVTYFITDQLLHLFVLGVCWYFTFMSGESLPAVWERINIPVSVWIKATALVFITTPAGILIGELTRHWREKIDDGDNSLSNAGKWIGITERIIVILLVWQGQYPAIGLLVTAKGIIRFSEKDRQEIKTEYLVLGTLLSIGLAIITGMITRI
ncbi:DUF3307 domain-containing protein [Flavitalea flava]